MHFRSISTLVITFALFLGGVAVDHAIAQPWARKMFKEVSHDFGDVNKGDRPIHKFEIQNVFQENIRIARVYSSCGCTSVSLSKKMLKTWEKGEVICQFNSPAFDGFKEATVTVQFDRPYVGEIQLNIKGNIVSGTGINFSPKSIDFGQISDASFPERQVELSHVGGPDFRVVDVKSTFTHIKVQLQEKARQGNLVSYVMKTQLKPTVPHGFAQGELYVVVQDGKTIREVPISFSAKVVSGKSAGLRLSPERLMLNSVKPGQEVRKKVIIKADQPFRIVDVTCLSQAFRVKAQKESKKIHFVDVIYTGENKPGKHECELSFYTDISGDTPNKIDAVVEIVEPTDDGS